MLATIEVDCPKCNERAGQKCTVKRSNGTKEHRQTGPHDERRQAAREAPDPDLSGRLDPELLVPCPEGCAVGEVCGRKNPQGPYRIGTYHNRRRELAAACMRLLDALDSGPLGGITATQAKDSGCTAGTLKVVRELGWVSNSEHTRTARWKLSYFGEQVLSRWRHLRRKGCAGDVAGWDARPDEARQGGAGGAAVDPEQPHGEGVAATHEVACSPLTPAEEATLTADADRFAVEQPYVCAACGTPCSGEWSVYPVKGDEEEVPVCARCGELKIPEIRDLISQRQAAARGVTHTQWLAEQAHASIASRCAPAPEAAQPAAPDEACEGEGEGPTCEAEIPGKWCNTMAAHCREPGCPGVHACPKAQGAAQTTEPPAPDEACEGEEPLSPVEPEQHQLAEGQPAPVEPTSPAEQPARDVTTLYLTRSLLVQLPDDEIAEKALEIFRLEREIEDIKQRAKNEIEPKKNRIGALKDEVHKGRFENVRCREVLDFDLGTAIITRLDTEVELERRALTAAERQRELFPVAAPLADGGLQRALAAVGIRAEVRPDVIHGPRLDRYSLLLEAAKDLKVFTGGLAKLAFELGLEQRLLSWRQGSEPRSLELDLPRPSETWTRYGLADLQGWLADAPAGAGLPMCPGVDVLGRPYWLDLAKAPHLLVAGATGSGKSVALHSMLCSLLMIRSRDDVEFVMLDPKRVELRAYSEAAHKVTIVSDQDEMRRALRDAVEMMEERYCELEAAKVRDIDGYQALGQEMHEAMPRIVIVVEELADLVLNSPEAEQDLVRLAQKSRAAGIHLLLATQRPDADTFSGLLRSNVDARIALAVQKASESRIILDQDGAEGLMKPGDMLIRYGGTVTRCHGLYLSQEEIARVVDPAAQEMAEQEPADEPTAEQLECPF